MRRAAITALAVAAILVMSGCSGKVQTNPLPEEVAYHIPNRSLQLKPEVNETAIAQEFDRFVAEMMRSLESGEPEDIFSIGYRRKDLQ